jgi:hypothetical protein
MAILEDTGQEILFQSGPVCMILSQVNIFFDKFRSLAE